MISVANKFHIQNCMKLSTMKLKKLRRFVYVFWHRLLEILSIVFPIGKISDASSCYLIIYNMYLHYNIMWYCKFDLHYSVPSEETYRCNKMCHTFRIMYLLCYEQKLRPERNLNIMFV